MGGSGCRECCLVPLRSCRLAICRVLCEYNFASKHFTCDALRNIPHIPPDTSGQLGGEPGEFGRTWARSPDSTGSFSYTWLATPGAAYAGAGDVCDAIAVSGDNCTAYVDAVCATAESERGWFEPQDFRACMYRLAVSEPPSLPQLI